MFIDVNNRAPAEFFVGRTEEVERLRGLVREAAAGRGRSALVDGEPGIGKSALLAAALAGADALGCRVCWGFADEYGTRFPLRVMLDCLPEAAADEQGGVVDPRHGGLAGPSAAPVLGATERLLGLVDRLCAESPLVLVVDDLQWADEASLAVWARLSRLVPQLPLLLLGTCRPVPKRPELGRLRRALNARDAVMLHLGPLPAKGTVELVAGLAGAPPGPRLRQLAGRAAGNPLYVRELIDALRREDRLAVRPGVEAELERPGESPPTLSTAIADRLGFLRPETQHVLRMAALLGSDFSVLDLAAVLGRPVPSLAGELVEAHEAGILVETGSRSMFRHSLIRHALYERAPVPLRIGLHRQAAEALAAAGMPAERVAYQLSSATGVMDMWVVEWLLGPGIALTGRAPQLAAELLRRALDSTVLDPAVREIFELQLAVVLRILVRFDELERFARSVLAREISATHRLRMAWSLAYTLLYSNSADAAEVARAALSGNRPADGDVWGARLSALYALCLVVHGDCGDPAPALVSALEDSERSGDRLARGFALHAQAFLLAREDLEKSVLVTDRALAAIGDDPEAADLRQVLLANRMIRLADLGRDAEADDVLAGIQALAGKDWVAGTARVHVVAAERHFDASRWDDALAELEVVEGEWGFERLSLEAHAVAALVAGHRGQRDRAAESVAVLRGTRLDQANVRNQSARMNLAVALNAEQDGREADALAALTPLLEPGRGVPHGRFRWLPELARLALSTGDEVLVRTAAELADAEVEREPMPLRMAVARECRGLLTGDVTPVLGAAEYYRETGRTLEQARALENAAVLAGRSGDVVRGRELLAEAVEVFEGLGATWDVERAEARGRQWGIRRAPRGGRERPTSGWAALTPTELTVASLVARGQSNPEIAAEMFLSRRTVQTHVSHILAKLGARSRVEIAAEAAQNASMNSIKQQVASVAARERAGTAG